MAHYCGGRHRHIHWSSLEPLMSGLNDNDSPGSWSPAESLAGHLTESLHNNHNQHLSRQLTRCSPQTVASPLRFPLCNVSCAEREMTLFRTDGRLARDKPPGRHCLSPASLHHHITELQEIDSVTRRSIRQNVSSRLPRSVHSSVSVSPPASLSHKF